MTQLFSSVQISGKPTITCLWAPPAEDANTLPSSTPGCSDKHFHVRGCGQLYIPPLRTRLEAYALVLSLMINMPLPHICILGSETHTLSYIQTVCAYTHMRTCTHACKHVHIHTHISNRQISSSRNTWAPTLPCYKHACLDLYSNVQGPDLILSWNSAKSSLF